MRRLSRIVDVSTSNKLLVLFSALSTFEESSLITQRLSQATMSHLVTVSLPADRSDHVFAIKHGVEIPLRIFPCSTPRAGKAPWLLYIHGGAFMTGQHWYTFPWLTHEFLRRGYHVVSIAYRLMPQVRYEDMMEDCVDAAKWCHEHLAEHVPHVDIDSYILGGTSAGGTLALSLGDKLQPAPKAVLDIYGLANFLNPFYYADTPTLVTDVVPTSGRWSDEELEKGIADRDPANAHVYTPNFLTVPEEELRKGWGTDQVKFNDRIRFHLDLRYYIRSQKRLLNVLHREENFPSKEAFKAYLKTINPVDNFTKKFPPTVIMHGDADTMVQIEESVLVAQRLRDLGVEVLEVYEPGQQHGYDRKYDVRWLLLLGARTNR